MWHILHKRFITWAIIQYLASNRGFKMDSSTSKDRLVYRGSSTHSQPYFKINEIISNSFRFTQKTSTCELCPSPMHTISISIAIGDGTETRSNPHLERLVTVRLTENVILSKELTPHASVYFSITNCQCMSLQTL